MLWALAAVSCSRMDEADGQFSGTHLYRMRFDCDIEGSDYAATKAGYVWEDGTVIHIQFVAKRTKGIATYNSATDEWIVETEKALTTVEGAKCEVYWLNGLEDPYAEPFVIGPEVSSFKDVAASYSFFDGGLLTVSAKMVPMTSRLRFIGEPGRTFTIDGLKYCSEYSFSSNFFTRVSETVTVNIGPDGSSDYYYVLFADSESRTLTIEGEYNTAFVRTFPETVLLAGASGYMTAPTPSDPGNWSFINKENEEEVNLPVISEVAVSNVRGTAARLDAQITDLGNGQLLSSGFVYGKSPSPTLENSMSFPSESTDQLSLRLGGLEKSMTYYVRAYASNPKGLVYSPEASFTTTDHEDDLYKDDFDYDEDNWDNGGGSAVDEEDISKEDWSDDQNWNNGTGGNDMDDDSIGKDEWPDDENWNDDEYENQ